MEWVTGVKLTGLPPLEIGFFHGDPHPGNLLKVCHLIHPSLHPSSVHVGPSTGTWRCQGSELAGIHNGVDDRSNTNQPQSFSIVGCWLLVSYLCSEQCMSSQSN